MKNQVYERVFKKLDAKRQKDLEEAEEEDDGTVDIRSDFLRQQRYVKYQECATFLWDSFTLGAKSKNAANEEKTARSEWGISRGVASSLIHPGNFVWSNLVGYSEQVFLCAKGHRRICACL